MNKFIFLTQEEKNLITGGSNYISNENKECIRICEGETYCYKATPLLVLLQAIDVCMISVMFGVLIACCVAKVKNKLH